MIFKTQPGALFIIVHKYILLLRQDIKTYFELSSNEANAYTYDQKANVESVSQYLPCYSLLHHPVAA